MIKPILAALLLASCLSVKDPYPTNTEAEKRWKQEYANGAITWEEYQALLKKERYESLH